MSRTIIRAARRARFAILDSRVIEDSRLRWSARGELIYLLSRPDNWRVLVKDLQRRGDLRCDGIYAVLRDLRLAGYVRFERIRNEAGCVREGRYVVSEEPASSLHPAWPDPAEPDLAKPWVGSEDSCSGPAGRARSRSSRQQCLRDCARDACPLVFDIRRG